MRALLAEVEKRLVDLGPATPLTRPELRAIPRPQQGALFRTQPGDQPESRAGSEDDEAEPQAENVRTPEGKTNEARSRDLPPDDRRRPSRFTLVQHPGVTPRPSKYTPHPSRDLVLDVPREASHARRFSAALDALVSEMKAKGTGSRSFVLNDGEAADLGTEDFGYTFDFVEDADIFEDAQVQVLIGSRRCSGSVVSLLPGQIILSLDTNLGLRIRTCILKVDNTALLVALKDRLDEVEQKTLNINTPLADATLSSEDQDDGSSALDDQRLEAGLDHMQEEAVRRALRRKVFYIWGPPGTGKTRTLAALVGVLFEAGKRVLVCSNTNQAVDQLLVKLCERLGKGHRALVEGKVLRWGRVTGERLGEYGDYLIVEKIVERLSQELQERRIVLQARIDEVETSLERVDGVLRRFEDCDRATEQADQMVSDVGRHRDIHRRARIGLEQATLEQEALQHALVARQEAGLLRRILMPSEAQLQQRVDDASRHTGDLASRLRDSITAVDVAAANLGAQRARASDLQRHLASHDRAQLLAEQKSIDALRAPLRDELSRIQAELSNLERSLLETARVIGTTVTRAYLSAHDLGAFDCVIVDEASMVLLPALYFVSGLARERVTISGDFNQLPPIVQSNQWAIMDAIGGDVFRAAGVIDACRARRSTPRVIMLDTQRRMVPSVCALIVEAMGYDGLKTHPSTQARQRKSKAVAPFDGPLTVLDSSRLWPFESRNILGSRFNLMHTLLVRNLCWHLREKGFIDDKSSLGVCTPYSAQAKLTAEILKDDGLGEHVTASTVHRYQGDEKRMMLLDIPESIGSGFNIGRFVQADQQDDDGAKLLNVAVSRTQDHLVILANLTYLDAKLPTTAMLRFYLHEMQRLGKVVDAEDVLALRPITADLRHYTDRSQVQWDADQAGVFRQEGFDRGFQRDVASARRSVAVFSGFVTPQRVGAYGDLFRRKVQEGVAVRCVTRPPHYNGSIDPKETKRALDSLEGIGVIVDTRAVIHEKVVIIDDETVWFGSLNPLSHTSRTDELMHRLVSKGWASKLAGLLAIAPGGAADRDGLAVRKENPTHCGGRMCYLRGKWGPYFKCEKCGHNQSVFRR